MKLLLKRVLTLFVMALWMTSCQPEKADTLFTRLSPEESGISFQNTIEESPDINILSYEYTYNGGGVAAGDFNNDGLCDLYFSGNTVSNKLYVNKGELTFKDITTTAGVSGRELWKTGVSAADVNGDGWLDLYVCYSGPEINKNRSNELYINNGCEKGGEPTFTESAVAWGVDAADTYSTQASFFDYDRDGDLDMFLINHGNHFFSPFINTNQLRNSRHPQFGNRLYRNDKIVASGSGIAAGDRFTEVSQEAGIHGGGINFGLGVSISDVNNDQWPDIFVTNDYEEQDFLYLNNGDGTFKESTKQSFGHLSRNGMGTDIADYNNDGWPDVIEVDMWPEDNYRQKLLKGPDDYNRYTLMVDSGFHHQQMRNTLQLNAGVGPDGFPLFCEVGQLAGVSATDWSWAPLFADVDNDGYKDLFVTNGYLRDFTSMDFLKYTVEEARRKAKQEGKELQMFELVGKMPSTKTSDYLFKNNGDLTFSNNSKTWGIEVPNLSFGATYADLDNDGDLELITNNTNEPATVWINHASNKHHYLKVRLKGPASNPYAIGARVTIKTGTSLQMTEQFLTRGFQSSVDPVLHFGLGTSDGVDELVVIWPDGKQSRMEKLKGNQSVEVSYEGAVEKKAVDVVASGKMFRDVSTSSKISFIHQENSFVDFDREPLIPYQLSRLGPALSKADVNGDGFEDFYIGGASGQVSQLYVSDGRGQFALAKQQPWSVDAVREDVGSTFFDADNDGDMDLFVVSGGNEFAMGATELDDRLYINDGKGNFSKAPEGSTVADHVSGSCVAAADYDRDGDMDLFVGGRLLPGSFPAATPGAILKNETDKTSHKVRFAVATAEVNPELREPGMVTDAVWTDYNNDSWPDLIIAGEWMGIKVFKNQNGKLIVVNDSSLSRTNGFWNRIVPIDYDNDGDLDYALGNAGGNLQWKISQENPLTMFYGDFNGDSRIDPVICYSAEGKQYPVASRDELLFQMTNLRKKFTTYSSYGKASIEDVLDKTMLDKSKKLTVELVQSVILENKGNDKFSIHPLPVMAQISNVQAMVTNDFNRDGFADILLAGNFFPYRTQYGRNDASLGLLLLGDGKGSWRQVSWDESGFYAPGDVRNMTLVKAEGGRQFVVIVRNDDKVSLIEYHNLDKNQ